MAEEKTTTPTVQANGDPSGVPRPVDTTRISNARENSGIIVGEVATPVQTTTGQSQDQYKTAFIKVYQDAGVIGVAMLTLLALCVAMAIFSSRVLKMYSALVTANNALVNTSAEATLRIATAMTLLDSELKAAVAEFRREHNGTVEKLDEILVMQRRADDSFQIMLRMSNLLKGDQK